MAKLPSGWGRSVIRGKEVITRPSREQGESGEDKIKSFSDAIRDEFNDNRRDNDEYKAEYPDTDILELDEIEVEARNKRKGFARAIASKKQ